MEPFARLHDTHLLAGGALFTDLFEDLPFDRQEFQSQVLEIVAEGVTIWARLNVDHAASVLAFGVDGLDEPQNAAGVFGA